MRGRAAGDPTRWSRSGAWDSQTRSGRPLPPSSRSGAWDSRPGTTPGQARPSPELGTELGTDPTAPKCVGRVGSGGETPLPKPFALHTALLLTGGLLVRVQPGELRGSRSPANAGLPFLGRTHSVRPPLSRCSRSRGNRAEGPLVLPTRGTKTPAAVHPLSGSGSCPTVSPF